MLGSRLASVGLYMHVNLGRVEAMRHGNLKGTFHLCVQTAGRAKWENYFRLMCKDSSESEHKVR